MKEATRPEMYSDKETGRQATRLGALLRRRAHQLAQRSDETDTPSASTPMMVFRLGEDRYALELSITKQVLPFKSCTRVPEAGSEVLGVMNVYGDIRLVVDAGRLLDLPQSETPTPGFVLFLKGKNSWLGVRVDAVEGVVPITDVESWKGKNEGQDKLVRCAKGMTADSIIVLDAAAILAEGTEEKR